MKNVNQNIKELHSNKREKLKYKKQIQIKKKYPNKYFNIKYVYKGIRCQSK